MAPTSRSASLKQGTLAFGAAKRTTSASSIGGKPAAGAKAKAKGTDSAGSSAKASPAPVPLRTFVGRKRALSDDALVPSDSEDEHDEDDVQEILKEDSSRESSRVQPAPAPAPPPAKRQRVRRTGSGVLSESVPSAPAAKAEAEARPKLNVKDTRWRKHYGAVREKMGNIEPVHGKDQTMVHHILRVFDLSYEYGPCIGVPRLQRWERAQALGLRPPPEVREILITEEAGAQPEFRESVFFGEV